ncbi:HAD-IIIA family hydrolase [Novosphingobium sp. MMS21-SN21R]|uniref:HAD-IIIA family hydrolase n=1 Tax=Novosphingobium sp. MMS21-SN21R TaxID=2969298 RepID=UPI0028881378|nr:HAD-IIIA family hydrolase [Novosphingobium sp. MMS21-SN21R]MDT0507083.1 HAD-IIIA family hydrolase [Novosphingobium sp. MMS21-SN21R]
MTQAVILAGGKGTRLASRLNGKPKPLVDVDGIPLLQRQIEALCQHGIDDIVILVNHAADQIQQFVDALQVTATITLIDDGEPRGTAGATLACLDRLEERFIVVYGDTLFDLDIAHMMAEHERSGADATLLLHPNDHPHDSDLVELDTAGRITAFHSYPHPVDAWLRNLVNAAFYIVERRLLEPWTDRMAIGDFAKDLFPAMVAEGAQLRGYVTFEYIKDIGTPKRLDKAERQLRSGLVARARRTVPQRAVFVDRDGTLNRLNGHIARAEDLHLIDGAGEAIRLLNEGEYRVVLVTNQPVLARGDVDEAGLSRIHARLESELGQAGAFLDAVYYCPHHPHAGYPGEVPDLKRDCDCRKPGTGMIVAACERLNIDLDGSWMIGDSTADIAMANAAGLRSILVETGEGGRDGKYQAQPTTTALSIVEAVEFLIRHDGPHSGSTQEQQS